MKNEREERRVFLLDEEGFQIWECLKIETCQKWTHIYMYFDLKFGMEINEQLNYEMSSDFNDLSVKTILYLRTTIIWVRFLKFLTHK